MNNYFAYGSNLNETQMKERCPDSRIIGRAVLKRYRIGFTIGSLIWKGGCADIIKSENDEVWGLIYEVSESDLKNLDKIEGSPYFYRRIVVHVKKENGEKIDVFAYEVVKKKKFIAPSEKYFEVILNASKKFNFPESYISYLLKAKLGN